MPSATARTSFCARTRSIDSVISAMFRDAKLADLIEQSPCCLDERHLTNYCVAGAIRAAPRRRGLSR
jgi:hypothetical protein